MTLKFTRNDTHVRYYVARDGNGSPALWADTAHAPQSCDDCAGDYRFPFGPHVVLMKEQTQPVVWDAACKSLTADRVPAPPTDYGTVTVRGGWK